MTIAVFNLTEHTQMSIRGTTGTHPDSKFVFGVYVGTDEIHAEQGGFTPDISAYSDMDWKCAVYIAEWIMKWEDDDPTVTPYNSFNNTMFAVLVNRTNHVKEGLFVTIEHPGCGSSKMIARVADGCDWERAVQMAKWILEWDERFKEEKE